MESISDNGRIFAHSPPKLIASYSLLVTSAQGYHGRINNVGVNISRLIFRQLVKKPGIPGKAIYVAYYRFQLSEDFSTYVVFANQAKQSL